MKLAILIFLEIYFGGFFSPSFAQNAGPAFDAQRQALGMPVLNADTPANVLQATANQVDAAKIKPVQFKKHAVVMLAVNYSEGEIEAARTAAVARGEQFVLLPEMTKEVKEGAKMAYEAEKIQHRSLKVLEQKLNEAKTDAERKELSDLLQKEEDKVAKLNEKVGSLNLHEQKMGEIFKKKVTELENAGVGVDALVISAHDGGGHFGGTFGSTSRSEIIEIANKDPKLQSSLRSVYMMGCYTATTDEARSWKHGFPEIELVGGYDQAAPLRDAPKGWNYVHDMMIAQKKLTDSKDLKKLNELADAITDINKSGTAFATFPKCADPKLQKEFYRGKVTNNQVMEFDPKMCTDAKEDFKKNEVLYQQYRNGELPIPLDTAHSPLRDLYSFYRNHEVCYSMRLANGPSADSVFFLLFDRPVLSNFKNFFHDDIVKLKADLASYDFRKMRERAEKELSELRTRVDDITRPIGIYDERRMNSLMRFISETDWEHPFKDLQNTLDALDSKNGRKEISRKDLMAYAEVLSKAESFIRSYDHTNYQRGGLQSQVYHLSMNMNNLLVAHREVPVSWHEEAQGKPEEPHYH